MVIAMKVSYVHKQFKNIIFMIIKYVHLFIIK